MCFTYIVAYTSRCSSAVCKECMNIMHLNMQGASNIWNQNVCVFIIALPNGLHGIFCFGWLLSPVPLISHLHLKGLGLQSLLAEICWKKRWKRNVSKIIAITTGALTPNYTKQIWGKTWPIKWVFWVFKLDIRPSGNDNCKQAAVQPFLTSQPTLKRFILINVAFIRQPHTNLTLMA